MDSKSREVIQALLDALSLVGAYENGCGCCADTSVAETKEVIDAENAAKALLGSEVIDD